MTIHPKRYGSVSCGVKENREGSLLKVADIIQVLDYILDDDELLVRRLKLFKRYLELG